MNCFIFGRSVDDANIMDVLNTNIHYKYTIVLIFCMFILICK